MTDERVINPAPTPAGAPWPRRRTPRVRRLPWHESWVVRTAALVSVILICGYAASMVISGQGISSISRIAYRKDIEQALTQQLQLIKENYRQRQELTIGRLRDTIPPQQRLQRGEGAAADDLTRWLGQANISGWFDTREAKIRPLTSSERSQVLSENRPDMEWSSQEDLRVYHFVVTFPRGETYQFFREIESLLQGYQLIGAKLNEEIQPAMVRAQALVLLFMFTFLGLTFWLLARRFKARVEEVIDGFVHWSEQDAQFRFDENWSGELRLITKQFNSMADEVEANRQRSLNLEKLASWQTIARKLAHEIKNPLTPIQMMVSQLHRRYQGDDQAYQKLLNDAQTIITEEVAGLRRMVDNFSEFARLPVPKFHEADLVSLAHRVVELQKVAFEQHQIIESHKLGTALCQMDEDLIRQVLINLIKNAAEASSGRNAVIEVSVGDDGDAYSLLVKDDGPGIPGDLQARVFEAYFTTKHTGPTPGMGLGLAVCQKIALDHGGDLRVTSRPGDTRFLMRIPKQLKSELHDHKN